MLSCYVAHQCVCPIMATLRPYSAQRMNAVVALGVGMAAALFLVISVGGAVAFGPQLRVNVLQNLSPESLGPLVGGGAVVVQLLVQGSILLSLLGSFLLFMYPLRTSLAEMMCELHAVWRHSQGGEQGALEGDPSTPLLEGAPEMHAGAVALQFEARWFNVLTYGLFAAIVACGMLLPDIWEALNNVAGVASILQAFIAPGVIAVALATRPATLGGGGGAGSVVMGWAVVVLGVILLALHFA